MPSHFLIRPHTGILALLIIVISPLLTQSDGSISTTDGKLDQHAPFLTRFERQLALADSPIAADVEIRLSIGVSTDFTNIGIASMALSASSDGE